MATDPPPGSAQKVTRGAQVSKEKAAEKSEKAVKMIGTIPGAVGAAKNRPSCDSGTNAMTNNCVPGIQGSPAPQASPAKALIVTEPYPKWTVLDASIWKLVPDSKGGGDEYLFRYKDGWISHNKADIKAVAEANNIPIDLLAGVAWAEVGGMPDVVDAVAYPIRSFDWSGPNWMDKKMTITKDPDLTSVGSVSIQLRNVGALMGIDLDKLNYAQKAELIKHVEVDAYNLEVVAKYLVQLIKHDYPNISSASLTDEQIAVAASRYNRGTARKLSDFVNSIKAPPGTPIRSYSSYGRTLLRHRERVSKLLQ